MSGLCKDCKWWSLLDDDSPEFGGECLLAEGKGWHPVYGQTRAHAIFKSADSEPEVNLLTYYDFGCVQFEAKE